MSLMVFITVYAFDLLPSLWVLRWGGAEWMEYRFRAGLFFGYFAIGWSAEQIKLYVFLWLIISTAIFVIGLFVPAVREAVIIYNNFFI